jgi:hypothetical protein
MSKGNTSSEAIELTKEDREQLLRLGVSPSSIIAEYDSFCAAGSLHADSVRSVFRSFGTAKVNQGVYRRVITAYRATRKKKPQSVSKC